MREIKKFISIDNKEFNTEKECADYEEEILDYVRNELLDIDCLKCQNHSLCRYLFEKNVCRPNLCDFIINNIIKEFGK